MFTQFRLFRLFSVVFLLMIVFSSAALAHLEGGQDIPTGNYTVDIGYDAENIVAGKPTVFLISLTEAGEKVVETSSLWVRITNPQQEGVFIAKLYPEPTGAYSFTTYFPQEGDYELAARFTTLTGEVQNKAVLQVGTNGRGTTTTKIVVVAVIVVVLVSLWWRRKLHTLQKRV